MRHFKLLRKNDITGMPVIEDDMTLVGVMTEKNTQSVLLVSTNGKLVGNILIQTLL